MGSGQELTLTQRISIQLRLGQRITVSVGDAVGSIGLRSHLQPDHAPCRRRKDLSVRIDYHEGKHEADYIVGCPGEHFDAHLQEQVYRCIMIEDMGGLSVLSSRAVGHLPTRLVEFYRAVLQARDRLLAERSELHSKLAKTVHTKR